MYNWLELSWMIEIQLLLGIAVLLFNIQVERIKKIIDVTVLRWLNVNFLLNWLGKQSESRMGLKELDKKFYSFAFDAVHVKFKRFRSKRVIRRGGGDVGDTQTPSFNPRNSLSSSFPYLVLPFCSIFVSTTRPSTHF